GIGLAKAYAALGEFDKALTALRRDESVAGLRTFTDVVSGAALSGGSIYTFSELPKRFLYFKALHETGRIAEAKEGYDRLLAHPGTQNNGDIVWLLLFDRGRIAEGEGRLQEAFGYFRRAIATLEQQRSTINTEANKIGFVGNKQDVYYHAVRTLI